MINNITIKNFKCYDNISLTFGALNLFSGLNSMGKSTVIQTLLLLRQSEQNKSLPSKIYLNGEYINLGTGKDILYEGAELDEIELSLNSMTYKVAYDSKNSDSDVLDVVSDTHDPNFILFKDSFEYLCAERVSPQTTYQKGTLYVQRAQLGINGQYTVHYLSQNPPSPSWNSYEIQKGDKSFKSAVQYWLDEISPGIKLDAQKIVDTDLAKLTFYYDSKSGGTNKYRPSNVGFGISYVLPVIVAILKTKPGSILIIENPEAHLHPRGQRKIGELIAKCAASGIQVFIETHSDHVVNGIRIAVKKKDIPNKDVKLFYFTTNEDLQHIVEEPKINENGKLDYWPEGFLMNGIKLLMRSYN